MTAMREQLSAWLLVTLLALAAFAEWGGGAAPADRSKACVREADARVVARLPRGDRWAPDPVLTGLPVDDRGLTSYEAAELAALERRGGRAVQPACRAVQATGLDGLLSSRGFRAARFGGIEAVMTSRPTLLRSLLVPATLLLLALSPAGADETVVSAPEAWAQAQAGELLIVDVRTEAEWTETGVAPGAARVSLYSIWGVPNDDFVQRVLELAGGDRDRRIAVICATGGRSAYAADMLREAGFGRVLDIGEGMFGNDAGVGWLSRALPVEPCDTCPAS